jgi:hypothetical protein
MIRIVYAVYRIRIFSSRSRIKKGPGSRMKKVPDPGSGSAFKNLSILTPKLFLSFRKYDP